ncbi:MAG TPA: hypothetical protein VHC49_10950 [Mycobacteriales bacterium]|nr:hypothetical protein [Mycobacteriales bacterium]
MIKQTTALTVATAVILGVVAGCSTSVRGTGEAVGTVRPPASSSSAPSPSPSPSASPTPRPTPTADPAEPVACMNGAPEKCFGTPLHELEATLRAAGYQCGQDILDEKCSRSGPDEPSYTFRGLENAPRIYEMRFTVDVQNQPLAAVQARVMDGLPRLTQLAFPRSPALASAAMSWFRAHRPGATDGPSSETHGSTHNPDYTVFCHASKVSINAEGLGQRWTTTMECGISTIGA